MRISLAVVLEIALGIERKGIEVYRELKNRFEDPLLEYLIRQEQEHIRAFQEVFKTQKTGSNEEGMDTPHLDEDYLAAAYANTEIFGQVKPDNMSAKGLWPMAIVMEKESIRFYLELLEQMPDLFQEQRALVRRIAGEERQHLRDLLTKSEAFTVER